MMYGLSEDVIKNLKKIFSKYEMVEKVVIYGSRAKGNDRKGSDIDLTFLGNHTTFDVICEIDNEIEALNLPYLFDLSVFRHIDNKELIEHIERIGKVFYEKKGA